MRSLTLGTGLVLSGLMLGPAADAARHHVAARSHVGATQACAPAHLEGEEFDVTGLKSELMVTALSCNEQDRYNAFVAKFHSELIDEEAALNSYFRRAFGSGAQKAHDDYITQLANVQADKGLQAGVAFCQQRMSMFDEVQVLDNAHDLSGYARGKDIVQPVDFQTCGAPGEAPARARRATAHTTHTRSHH